jgi:hypothetical protein
VLKGLAVSKKNQAVSGQTLINGRNFNLSWSHNVFLMGIKNLNERGFYEREAADQLSKEINAEIEALILGTKKLNENNRGKYNKKQVNSVRF